MSFSHYKGLLNIMAKINFQNVSKKINEELVHFKDLLDGPTIAILSTFSMNGYPHATVVWFDYDDTYFRINTMKGFQKEKNMKKNPLINLLIYNPMDSLRSIEIRGEIVEMTELHALDHLNNLTLKYTGKSQYFGDCIPKHFEESEIPVLCKIKPLKIITLPKNGEDEP